MKDGLGREIDYMRISVTDRCNLRCRYCMPEDGIELMKHDWILSFEELERICGLGAALGIRNIKITGGEPLARKDVAAFIRRISAIPGIEDITMTSNGCLLGSCARELKEAGLSCVNISLDTLNPQVFAYLTRRNAYAQVMNGIEEAKKAGLAVKINCAVVESLSKEDVLDFARFSVEHQIPVRFIEMMPIGQGKSYEALDNKELLHILKEAYPNICHSSDICGHGPAVYYEFGNPKGYIGFISAVHHKFCGSCNRIRLTSDGFLRLCLDSDAGVDLRGLMRQGVEDIELQRHLSEAILRKPASHHFGELEAGRIAENGRNMNQIGG